MGNLSDGAGTGSVGDLLLLLPPLPPRILIAWFGPLSCQHPGKAEEHQSRASQGDGEA